MPALALNTMLALMLGIAVSRPASFGQHRNQEKAAPPPAARAARSNPPEHPNGPNANRVAVPPRPPANPITAVDRWNAMNPKQRERLLSKMPPERQKQFLEKIQKFNSLPREEQQLARERYNRLSKLPPEEQQLVLRDIRRLNNLPPARQQAMNQEFLKLRQMSESERAAYMDSSEFKDRFYPAEQQMIANLSKVLATRK